MEVHVTAEMAPNFAVKPVAQAQIALLQEVSGRIEANERQVTRIGAAATGRVTEVLVEVGDRVRAGQVLARAAQPETAAGPRPLGRLGRRDAAHAAAHRQIAARHGRGSYRRGDA